LAEMLVRAGHPLGPLYASAVALERGDAAEAGRLAAASPVPLASRLVGRQLEQALVLRAFGASAVVRDRRGALVGGLDGEGRLALAEDLDPLLLPPFQDEPPRRRRLPARVEPASPYWLSPADARAAARSGGLRLTLDLDLARLALDALGRWRGTIVLVEPRTGAVLAAVSDPRTRAREGPATFSQRREPASISKIITAAAAYRSGIDADAAIARMTCRGVERFGGKPLWCSWKAGPLAGLDHALAISCNTSFARVGARVGRERLADELRRWGFDAGPEALMGAAGRIHTPPRNARQLADLSIGLTVSDITPLHAALLATVVVNGGTMPEPRLVANVCGPVGLADRVAVLPPVREVVGPRTVPPLLRAMRAVALYGTGTGLTRRGFPVAMKTGTAAEYRKGYHVNYIGVAPTPDSAVAFCVRGPRARSPRRCSPAWPHGASPSSGRRAVSGPTRPGPPSSRAAPVPTSPLVPPDRLLSLVSLKSCDSRPRGGLPGARRPPRLRAHRLRSGAGSSSGPRPPSPSTRGLRRWHDFRYVPRAEPLLSRSGRATRGVLRSVARVERGRRCSQLAPALPASYV
jgi:hypothetical protein